MKIFKKNIKKEKEQDNELDDPGMVLGKYKRRFFFLGLMILFYLIVFILKTLGKISLMKADMILIPVTLIAMGLWMKILHK